MQHNRPIARTVRNIYKTIFVVICYHERYADAIEISYGMLLRKTIPEMGFLNAEQQYVYAVNAWEPQSNTQSNTIKHITIMNK